MPRVKGSFKDSKSIQGEMPEDEKIEKPIKKLIVKSKAKKSKKKDAASKKQAMELQTWAKAFNAYSQQVEILPCKHEMSAQEYLSYYD